VLDPRRLFRADVQVGVAGTGEGVGRGCGQSGLLGGHRLEPSHDPPDGRGLAGGGLDFGRWHVGDVACVGLVRPEEALEHGSTSIGYRC